MLCNVYCIQIYVYYRDNKPRLLPNMVNPSCLQVTVASRLSQLWSQILPQVPFTHTWTVPLLVVDPNKRRTLPSVQLSGTNGASRVE